MAGTSDAVELTIKIGDEVGRERTMSIYLPWMTNDPANSYEALADEICDEIFKMTNGEMLSATVHVPVQFDFSPTAAVANSDVNEGGRFVFRTEDGTKTSFTIPCFREDLLVAGTDVVDVTHGDVTGFMDILVNGADADPGAGTNLQKIMDYRGAIVATVLDVVEWFYKTRKAASG